MARRNKTEEESSLELLLDTVCNAFGGIIFIVLLLMILPVKSPTGESDNKAGKPASMVELAKLEALKAELSQKERVLEVQKSTSVALELPESRDDLKRKADLEQAMQKLKDRITLQSQDDDQIRKKIEQLNKSLVEMKDLQQRLQTGLINLRNQKEQGDVRITHLPRLHAIQGKFNYFLVVYQGRVYLTHKPGQNSLELYDNTDDFNVQKTDDSWIYIPHSGKGTPVEEWLKASDGCALLQSQLLANQAVINICIYADSIGSFLSMRNAFTSKGYDYNWAPLSEQKPLILVRARHAEAQ